MSTRLFLLVFVFLISQSCLSQDVRFFIESSRDTILAGHLVELTYHIENAKSDRFEPPEFIGFTVLSGPQQSSSVQILNGKISKQATITYILASEDEGEFAIEPARLIMGDDIVECPRKTIVVLANPAELPDPQYPGYRPRVKQKEPLNPRQELLRKRKKVYKM